ncbi:hypothetical protein KTT66_02330 [Lacticaseibacillus casei]|jgi:hypothetical protein|uniref:BS_ysoA related protein with TPR repeats n=1 Tax=Lacticaseibacillus huelsenbergensis TaxID=3035291 RepID=A0ABY8DQR2_9LACO|nr:MULTISPECIES: hypothetical protein [Lacticaseibacillus]MDG3061650.1 hypothetical protein [Lacticaseibacillus sp. BCRC 81376]QVI37894.1 hypothetical protein KGS74_02635 [Lacticaseibacillus casei]QXG59684.1 hypothetical protein KTT66_02330 [Lacticaseibacillus casei]WFB38852.1 hypothetical protein LHUE1_002397 [Lacticaseibacillus huelsenbergensis]WFB43245.1 hypothetical protein LHUE2_001319 [Lacticaseibacillus huelsenbergensis]
MAKMVSLPDNENRHFVIGEKALQKGNFASAAAHLEKAYEVEQNFATARPLAASLNGLKQYHESLNVILPHYKTFLETDADTQLALDAWLGTLNFVMARTMLRELEPERRQHFLKQIEKAEEVVLKQRGEQIADLVRKLSHLGGFSRQEQQDLFSQIGLLPKAKLIEAAVPDLTDLSVPVAMRVSLLDLLTNVGYDQPVQYQAYDRQETLIPSELPGMAEEKAGPQILARLQDALGDDDQELGKALVQMARVQVAFLYPDIERLIPDQAAFVQAYLDHHQGKATNFDKLFAWQAAETAKLSE